jgi:hypothetical protein
MSVVPTMSGVIDRRILVNYRVDPGVLDALLPSPFRPQLVHGYGIAGICLIRLRYLRPQGLPPLVGLTTENAAHRIAVEWDGPDGAGRGVYIPRRDSPSLLTVALGGRLFPGAHHRAAFTVDETGRRLRVGFASRDGSAHASIDATRSVEVAADSVFGSLDEASAFFEGSPLGYSPTHRPGRFEGLELRCRRWAMAPLRIEGASSSIFESDAFPTGTAVLDSAFLMTDIPASWHGRDPLTGTDHGARSLSGTSG